jgi:hypothetical protein
MFLNTLHEMSLKSTEYGQKDHNNFEGFVSQIYSSLIQNQDLRNKCQQIHIHVQMAQTFMS